MTAAGPVGWVAVALAAVVLGRLLSRAVRWLEPEAAGTPQTDRRVEIVFVAAALALWWWEIHAGGQLPRVAGGVAAEAATAALVLRYAAHLLLLTLLAAATWIDLRLRVIPDGITVPGVLIGMGWAAAFPATLLPIVREVPRSFAAPALEADVLGLLGGLHATGLPDWLGGRPALLGLVVTGAGFLAWWGGCTSPPFDAEGRPVRATGGFSLLIQPRQRVLAAGLLVLVAAWAAGGDHWAGLLASLGGMLIAGAIVWLTRIGASWALEQEALGFGDVTLMAMAGSWLGWQACLLACFAAVFIGLVHGLGQVALRREHELPFGPSLCLALALVLIAWRPVWRRAGPFFERPGELAAVVGLVIVLTAVSLFVWRRLRGGGTTTLG
jgi:leader peptidase (prepilin peptidase)/N-methyltransferase